MNRREDLHPLRHDPKQASRSHDDGRYAYRESLAPRYGQPAQPPTEHIYGVGLSQPQGGYVDRESRSYGAAGDYQQVRPWGPQDGVDRYRDEPARRRGFGERDGHGTRHDAAVHAEDHGLGPDIAPTRDFRGRGPKSYRRSDERVKEDISDRLRDDPRIDASDIAIDVTGGRVSLSGEVDSRRTKHQVEDLVDACRGVEEIDNRLRIRAATDD